MKVTKCGLYWLVVCVVALFPRGAMAENQPGKSTGILDLKRWEEKLRRGDLVPFSMRIGDRPAKFQVTGLRDAAEGEWRGGVVTYREAEKPLMVYLKYRHDPWFSVARLTITLSADRALGKNLNQIKILDLSVPPSDNEVARLRGITGSFGSIFPEAKFLPRSLRPWERSMGLSDSFHLDSDGTGRSSNSQIPLWVYAQSGGGLWFGPEWSGCWDLTVARSGEGSRLRIGLPALDFTMLQGEEIELPTAAFGPYAGKPEDGYNALRKAIREHYLPTVGEAKPIPLVVFQGLSGMPNYQDEPTLYREAERAAQVGAEAFVLDAGWYYGPETRKWWETIGHWEPSPKRFPGGITRFADYLHSKGMRFGLWLEPRMRTSLEEYQQNKDLFLTVSPDALKDMSEESRQWVDGAALLNLGKREGEEWLVKTLERFIIDYKADWIWFDFNTDPRRVYWNYSEEKDRRGLSELGFYQGWYRVFETIHKRYPYVWLESCASGGRLIDLGQLGRFHSIWINDSSLDDDANRNFRGGLNNYLPAVYLQNAFFVFTSAEEVLVSDAKPLDPEKMDLHGGDRLLTYFGGDLQFGQGLAYWKERDIQEAARYVAKYKQYRRYLDKSYYNLFLDFQTKEPSKTWQDIGIGGEDIRVALPQSRDAWDGWQFHDPETDTGIVLLFRLKNSLREDQIVKLHALKEDRQYAYSVIAGDGNVEAKGTALGARLDPGKSVLVHYEPR